MRSLALLLVFSTFCCELIAAPRSRNISNQPVATHGTINLLIGNKHGVVAETDTMLSHDNRAAGRGQKLFQVDDRTICMVADFYSDPGPRSPDLKRPYPFATSIPDILQRFINNAPAVSKATFSEKVDILTQALAFDLQVVSILHDIDGDDSPLPSSRITVAGYDGGTLKVQQVKVSSSGKRRAGMADVVKDPEIILGDQVRYFTAGADDKAKAMLNSDNSPLNAGSPEMNYFYSIIQARDAGEVNLESVKQVEDEIEIETAKAYPNLVGGDREVAFLEGGRIIRFDAPVLSKPIGVADPVALSWGNTQNGGGPAHLGEGEVYINVRFTVQNAVQDLDRSIYSQSTFLNTTFRYQGNGPAIFDGTNFLVNCRLLLGPRVKDSDPFVAYIREHYPSMAISR